MSRSKSIIAAVINKNFSEADKLLNQSLMNRINSSLDERKKEAAQSIFGESFEENEEDTLEEARMENLDFIMEVEEEGFDPNNEYHVDTLQHMIDTGLVWKLQGFWGRLASRAIDQGIVEG